MKTALLFVLSISLSASAKELVDKIVASVGTEVVLKSELNQFPKRIGRIGAIDETLLLGEKAQDLTGQPQKQLEFLIREKILDAEIKRLGLNMTESQIDSELAQMAKRGNMSSSDFSNYLSQQGYSLQDYKQILRNRLERQSLFEREIIGKLRITDDDALSVYQSQNPTSVSGISEFKIAQIFFDIKKGGVQQAQARAEAALQKLNSGTKFETLANQLDETPGANPDGYLGSFKAGEFIPQIEKNIAGLNENQTSQIIRGPNGFHIVKLLSKKTVVDPRFARVKEAIKSQLVQQNFERQLKNMFELKKIELDVKVYDKTL